MNLKLYIGIILFVPMTAACSNTDSAYDWDSINYKRIACKGNRSLTGCESADSEDIMTSGRSKGR